MPTMDGDSEGRVVRQDSIGTVLKVGDRVRNTKAAGTKLGTLVSLIVPEKDTHVDVKWDDQTRGRAIKASSLRVVREDQEKAMKARGEDGKGVFDPKRSWRACSLTNAQIDELKRVGITQHKRSVDEQPAAKAKVSEYSLGADQLANKNTNKWATVNSVLSSALPATRTTGMFSLARATHRTEI